MKPKTKQQTAAPAKLGKALAATDAQTVYLGAAVMLDGKPASIGATTKGAKIMTMPRGKIIELSWPEVAAIMERKQHAREFQSKGVS